MAASKDEDAAWHPRENARLIVGVVIMACAVDAADKALLPATFKAISEELDLGAKELGQLTFAQSIMFSASLPLWGSLMRKYSVRDLMVVGCLMWSALTVLLAFTWSYRQRFLVRLLIGVALASVNPLGQAVICDVIAPSKRGRAFGIQASISKAVEMSVAFGATACSQTQMGAFEGWRVSYLAMAGLSLLTGLAVLLLVPRDVSAPHESPNSWFADQRRILGAVASKPSFLIMVAQGVTGGIPWNAFAYLTYYFQLSGYSNVQAGEIMLYGGFGGVVGGLLGGYLGDRAAKRFRDSGRCMIAQLSVILGSASFLWMMNVPMGPHSFLIVSLAHLIFNAVAVWTGAAALRPFCGELFNDSQERAQIFAMWIALEGIISSLCGAPMVGIISDFLGTELHHSGGPHVGADTEQADAIRTSLIGVSMIPWTFCLLAWVPMYWTYPRDRDRAALEASSDSETESNPTFSDSEEETTVVE